MKNITITETEQKRISKLIVEWLDRGYEDWEKLSEKEKEEWNEVFEFAQKLK